VSARNPSVLGIVPVKQFFCNAIVFIEVNCPKLLGISPTKLLAFNAKNRASCKFPSEEGIVDVKELLLIVKVIKLLIRPIVDGIVPKNLLLAICSTSNCDRSYIESGMLPTRSRLLSNTRTTRPLSHTSLLHKHIEISGESFVQTQPSVSFTFSDNAAAKSHSAAD
jgi:hypothetical protein